MYEFQPVNFEFVALIERRFADVAGLRGVAVFESPGRPRSTLYFHGGYALTQRHAIARIGLSLAL